MFLRQTRRKKDGKTHSYWSVVENQRLAGGRVGQRQVLYLGEISPSQAAAWRKSIEVFDEDTGYARTLALFPEDRAAGHPGDCADRIAERLDHDLLLAEQFVDDEAAATLVVLHGHDQRVGQVFRPRRHAEQTVEPQDRQQAVPHHAHFATRLHRGELFGLGADTLLDAGDRHDVAFRPDPYDHAVDDGKRQRQVDRERRAFPGNGLDVDSTAQGFDVLADHVHADAAAGDVGHLVGRR